MKKLKIILSVIALTAVLVMGLIIKTRIERQREIDLMIEQNEIGILVRVFNLKDKDGHVGFSVNKEYCTVEQYYNLLPTEAGDEVIATTQETINNLNSFAEKYGIHYDGQICEFTMEELLNDPMGTYKKLEVYNEKIQNKGFNVDIANIADGFYNKDEE